MTSIQNIQSGQIAYLYSQLGNIPPPPPPPPFPTSSNLADVLLNGFNAGASDIDMNNNDILNVSNIDLATINGAAYPPVVAADNLQQVLTAGNTANVAILIEDVTTPSTLFTQMSDVAFTCTDATGFPQNSSAVSASNIFVGNTNGDSSSIGSGGMAITTPISTANYSNSGINAGNQVTSIDYQVTSNQAIPSDGHARLDLTSGDLSSVPPRAVLQAFVDLNTSPPYPPNINLIDLGGVTGEELLIANGNSDSGLGIAYNTIIMFSDSTPSSSFIQLQSIDAATSIGSSLILGLQSFNLIVTNQPAINIGGSVTAPVIFQRNISTTTGLGGLPVGMLENSVINLTTTGTTPLAISNAFSTIINTPTASGRIFVLQAPTAGTVGYWYAICNKSTANTIAVHFPAGTTIATIPVATAVGGGSVARFAVTTGGGSYFRVN